MDDQGPYGCNGRECVMMQHGTDSTSLAAECCGAVVVPFDGYSPFKDLWDCTTAFEIASCVDYPTTVASEDRQYTTSW